MLLPVMKLLHFYIKDGFCRLLSDFAKLWKANFSFILSARLSVRQPVRPLVRIEQLGSHWTDFQKNFILFSILQKYVEKIKDSLKSDEINCNLQKVQYALSFISRSFILRMRNVPDGSCRENQNTHFYVK